MPLGVQVKRAEQHLLEALYGHISSLGKFESDTLLEEDPDTMQRRAATRKVGLPPQLLLHCEPSPAVAVGPLCYHCTVDYHPQVHDMTHSGYAARIPHSPAFGWE